MVHTLWNSAALHSFVECLKSLPNLYTLEIGWMDRFIANPLESALSGVKLPQIKTLIIPPDAHPLFRHCDNLEDVICVVGYPTASFDRFLGSLVSYEGPKIKRLAIPPALWTDPSRK